MKKREKLSFDPRTEDLPLEASTNETKRYASGVIASVLKISLEAENWGRMIYNDLVTGETRDEFRTSVEKIFDRRIVSIADVVGRADLEQDDLIKGMRDSLVTTLCITWATFEILMVENDVTPADFTPEMIASDLKSFAFEMMKPQSVPSSPDDLINKIIEVMRRS